MPKVKKFRCQYLTYGLTYSQSGTKTKEQLRDFLLGLSYPIEDYYIVQETHKDGGFHLHVWFNFSQKPNIVSPKYFDFEGLHPNIGNKKRNWIWNYLKKQDKQPLTNIATGYIQLAIDGRVKEATEQFINMHPKDYAINKERIDKNFASLSKKKKPDKIYPFTGEVFEWDWNTKSLLINDQPRVGKTQWAKSFITHHLKQTYLRVTHVDKLKEYNGEDWIIYDDCSFLHMPRNTQVHIATVEDARDIHCRHKCASIPAGVKQIFLNNPGHHPFTQNQDLSIEDRLEYAPSIRFY